MEYNHLQLPLVFSGRPRLFGGGGTGELTRENKTHRNRHAEHLRGQIADFSGYWFDFRNGRSDDLPVVPNDVPILIRIDENEADIDYLVKTFNFEIVSEVNDGYIIVSSDEIDLNKLLLKIEDFTSNIRGSAKVAEIYDVLDNNSRLQLILNGRLLDNWDILPLQEELTIDVSIECIGTVIIKDYPKESDYTRPENYERAVRRWKEEREQAYIDWDDLVMEREGQIESFVQAYNGTVIDSTSYIDDGNQSEIPDSFTMRIKISVEGFKDLVLNYPYIFEVDEPDIIQLPNYVDVSILQDNEDRFELLAPNTETKVCVIDSGLQEGHRFLSNAVLSSDSISYIDEQDDVSDEVHGGGHGTRVAGAILYPNSIPISGSYQAKCWIQNARVLDAQNKMPNSIFPPKVLNDIVTRFSATGTKIFNHSIASSAPFRKNRMSVWAASIDNISHSKDVLFVQAVGNVMDFYDNPNQKGVHEYLEDGINYPQYLFEPSCGIRNPSQSLHALTVGAICNEDYDSTDYWTLSGKDKVATYSSSGTGIWNSIKPEVVEYGGDVVFSKVMPTTSRIEKSTSPELIRKSPEGPAFDKDTVGTSFAAPKVTGIAANINNILPESSSNLLKAIIVNSARWPNWTNNEEISEYDIIRNIGYGIPDNDIATTNNDYRVTFYHDESVGLSAREAHVFKVPIPEEIRRVGDEYDVRIDICLSFTAPVRRTRKNNRKYHAVWLDWKCSNIGESPEDFLRRIDFDNEEDFASTSQFQWKLMDRTNRGRIRGVSRNVGAIQKDWTIIKSHQLTEGFCISIEAHEGWCRDIEQKAKYALAVTFDVPNQEVEIYQEMQVLVEIELENEISLNSNL